MMQLQALTFDVFGTVVDWHASIVREGEALDPSHALHVDWPALATAWRRLYRPTLDEVTRGARPWATFDELQRSMLDQVLETSGARTLPEPERVHLSAVWRRLDAWPDASSGLARLKRKHILAALSNGSIRQLVDLARFAGLPWDAVLSVELFGAYKPDPRVYRGAVELLQAPASEVMMVAAHVYDLRAARSHGMRTAFVQRPDEWGVGSGPEQPEAGEFDIVAADFEDLAAQLGC